MCKHYHTIPPNFFLAKIGAVMHDAHVVSRGCIKAPWDILETPNHNHPLKCIKFFRPKRNLGSHRLSLRFCPARGHITKMHLIIFDPAQNALNFFGRFLKCIKFFRRKRNPGSRCIFAKRQAILLKCIKF